MNNLKVYSELYEELYRSNYIDDDNHSHLYEKEYSASGLLHVIDEASIEYHTVLDVGCGRGNGIAHLKQKQKDVYGVEISHTAVNAAKQKGLDVIQGSITSIPYPENKFDLVVSTDVVEHLYEEDVIVALTELKRVSKKYIALKIAPCKERGTVDLLNNLHERGLFKDIDNLHITSKPPEYWIRLLEEDLNLEVIKVKIDEHPNPEIGIHSIRIVLKKEG